MKLILDKNLNLNKEKQNLLSDFCIFCAENLPIENPFKVYLVSNREPYGIATTAMYNIGQNECYIYGKNRSLVDVLRSIAHEMTHMMQDELGLLVGKIKDAGGFHEDQANARAGELLKRFAKSTPARKKLYESLKNSI